METDSLYQKMETVWKEREALFQDREKELSRFREEVKELEASCARQKEALTREAECIAKEKESLKQEWAKLGQEREVVWQKLKQQKEEIAKGFTQIVNQRLELQQIQNEKLRQEAEQEKQEWQMSRKRLSIGPKQLNTGPEMEGGRPLPPPEPSLSSREEAPPDQGKEPPFIPPVLEAFAKEAGEAFPQGRLLELTEEAFCIQAGDKELRILCGVPGSPMSAVILSRRKDSRQLQKGIEELNRSQDIWEFSYQDNYLRCTMPFTQTLPPKAVLAKCTEAMQMYFK